ncbi:hypothetical protein ACFLZ1_02225 [Patescibacteria group bacterium]
MNKKSLSITILSFIVFIAGVLFVRFVIGGDEDTWICVQGQWVKHGVPSSGPPDSGCGYEGKEEKENEETRKPNQDKILNLLQNLKDTIDIKFSKIYEAEFIWNVEVKDDKTVKVTKQFNISGQGIKAESINDKDDKKISDYFEDQEFEIDENNTSNKKLDSMKGYKQENTVCLVSENTNKDKEATVSSMPTLKSINKTNTEIKCGILIFQE